MVDSLDLGRWQWWNDPEVKQQLGLTEATVKAVETIVGERRQAFGAKWQEFERERDKLNRMGASTDESAFQVQVMMVERLRSDLATSRTMMLFRIRKLLQDHQVKKLRQIANRRDQERAARDRASNQGR
jgi:hypothetical protein